MSIPFEKFQKYIVKIKEMGEKFDQMMKEIEELKKLYNSVEAFIKLFNI
jgi:hypothetical protein